MKHKFYCSNCKQQKTHESDFSTGYATNSKDEKICFECCGELDKQALIEDGKLTGYFVKKDDGKYYFSNWPGTFLIPVYYSRSSWHNFAGKNGRTDFWCTFQGKKYHGVQIGHNSQIARLKALKKQ